MVADGACRCHRGAGADRVRPISIGTLSCPRGLLSAYDAVGLGLVDEAEAPGWLGSCGPAPWMHDFFWLPIGRDLRTVRYQIDIAPPCEIGPPAATDVEAQTATAGRTRRSARDHALGDLHGVERRALAEVVAAGEQQFVLAPLRLADPSTNTSSIPAASRGLG